MLDEVYIRRCDVYTKPGWQLMVGTETLQTLEALLQTHILAPRVHQTGPTVAETSLSLNACVLCLIKNLHYSHKDMEG